MSLAVATMNTRERCSASQVRKAPSTRREVPPSLSAELDASAFSISSSHSTQGASASAEVSDSRRFFSDSPCHLEYKAPKSSLTSGTPSTPAAARAARLLPQPCTPNNSTPLGVSSSGALPSKATLRCRIQRRRFFMPPMSANCEVSDSKDSVPPRFSSWYLASSMRFDVVLGERAIVENGLARQPLDVVQLQASQVVDQLLDCLHIDPGHGPALTCPLARRAHHDHVPLILVRQPHRELRRQVFQLLWQFHLEADEHDGAGALVVFLRDVLERAYEQRVFEIGMEVEQHVDSGHRRRLDVPQELLGLRQQVLWAAHVDVHAQQALGHRPLEHAPVPATLRAHGRFAHQFDGAAFFAAFDDHQRNARRQQGLQFSGGGVVGWLGLGVHQRRTLAKCPEILCAPCTAVDRETP